MVHKIYIDSKNSNYAIETRINPFDSIVEKFDSLIRLNKYLDRVIEDDKNAFLSFYFVNKFITSNNSIFFFQGN